MMYNFTKEDIEMIEKFIDIRNKGYYADGGQVTEVYNRVLNKHVNPTNCGSCIRQRVNELETALRGFQRLSESVSEDKVDNTKEEENETLTEAEMMKIRMAKVRAHRKQNNSNE